jgi:hypothetical protein
MQFFVVVQYKNVLLVGPSSFFISPFRWLYIASSCKLLDPCWASLEISQKMMMPGMVAPAKHFWYKITTKQRMVYF